MGNNQAVETFYSESAFRAVEGSRKKGGRVWEVTIIGAKSPEEVIDFRGQEYVLSKNGRLYSCVALEESVPMWDGVKVYDNHLTDEEFESRQGMRSVGGEWVGTITNPWWSAKERKLKGILKLVDGNIAHKLREAYNLHIIDSVGLSIDTLPEKKGILFKGQPVVVIEGFNKIVSVDVVTDPAAGGSFDRVLASVQNREGGATMSFRKRLREDIKKALRELIETEPGEEEEFEQLVDDVSDVVDAAIGPDEEVEEMEDPDDEDLEESDDDLDDEELESLLREIMEQDGGLDDEELEEMGDPDEELEESDDDLDDEELEESLTGHMLEAVLDVTHRLDLQDSARTLESALEKSKLPAPLAKLIRDQFEGKVFERSDLMKAIKRTKEAFSRVDQSGRVSGLGLVRGTRHDNLSVGMGPRDKAEVEFMRLVAGHSDFRKLESAEESFLQERLAETAYGDWVKAGRPNYGTRRVSEWVYEVTGGNPLVDQRAMEAVTTSGMSSIVKNALNVMLAASYAKRHRWWEPLVKTEEVETIDDATLVRTYGIDTLAVVDEGDPYLGLNWEDDEETASFVKKGNYVGVTIETLLRDKVNEVRRIPDRLSTSWYNTISALVSGVFTTNSNTGPQLSDTGALFNATAVSSAGGHANLLATALSVSAYDAVYTAVQDQTDQVLGAGQKLLIEPKFLLVPTNLRATALQIRNSENIPGSDNNDVNPYYQQFEVVVVPNWTDADNWATVADPNLFPAIWLIFLRGRTVPELFTSDSETQGAMFTNDELRYKVRMLTWRFSSTYDCAPVADFRPLHKSNV